MPRFHILSDLHLEFGGFEKPCVEADLTILAGDIYTKGRCCPWLNATEFFGRPVVMVAGNHEFYGGRIESAIPKLKEVATSKGVTVLENEELRIGGSRILGSTVH